MSLLLLLLITVNLANSQSVFDWISQGGHLNNDRYVNKGSVTATSLNLNVPSFILTSNTSVYSTPGLNNRMLVFTGFDGSVQAFDKNTGALIWKKDVNIDYYNGTKPGAYSRNTPVFWNQYLIFGIQRPADLIVVDLATGNLSWKILLDPHPFAIITQSGQLYKDTFYVGTSSLEESLAASPLYICCTFVGGVKAIDLVSRTVAWSWSAIPTSNSGRRKWSGADVWGSSPAIDPKAGLIYVGTGNPTNAPLDWQSCTQANQDVELLCTSVLYPDVWFNAIVSLNLTTGALVAGRRLGGYDVWSGSCAGLGSPVGPNCPSVPGKDAEFAHAPVLVNRRFCSCETDVYNGSHANDSEEDRAESMGFCKRNGKYEKHYCGQRGNMKPVLYVGSKAGFMYCLDAVDLSTVWATSAVPHGVGGGFQWGITVKPGRVISGHSNTNNIEWTLKNGTKVRCGGWVSLDDLDGSIQWETVNPACYDPTGPPGDPFSNARSTSSWGAGPATSIKGGVLVGSVDRVKGPPMGTLTIDPYGDGTDTFNLGTALTLSNVGIGGWLYLLDDSTGVIKSRYETGASIFGGFSVDDKCAWVGSGYVFGLASPSTGTKVYGFCAGLTKPKKPKGFFYRDT